MCMMYFDESYFVLLILDANLACAGMLCRRSGVLRCSLARVLVRRLSSSTLRGKRTLAQQISTQESFHAFIVYTRA